MALQLEYVNLYYLGGFAGEPGNQYISTKGTAFVVPPVGEYVRLRQHAADDIIRRYPDFFTTNVQLARRVTGNPQNYRAPFVETMSVEELEALLAAKRAEAALEEEESENLAAGLEESDQKLSPRKVKRGRAAERVEEPTPDEIQEGEE